LDGGEHNPLIDEEFIDAAYCHKDILYDPDSIPDPIPEPDPILDTGKILQFFDACDNLDTDSLSYVGHSDNLEELGPISAKGEDLYSFDALDTPLDRDTASCGSPLPTRTLPSGIL
jgi:hypothetical protein